MPLAPFVLPAHRTQRVFVFAGDLSRAERKNLRAVYQGYYPTPGLMAFLWSDAMRRMTSGVLWAVMQARHFFAAGVLVRIRTGTRREYQRADGPQILVSEPAICCNFLSQSLLKFRRLTT